MQFSRKALGPRWAWTTVLAALLFAAIYLLDSVLRTNTGFGTADMQFVRSGFGLRTIADHWLRPIDAVQVGLVFGLDFLFIALYGTALFFGALAALDRFAPNPGVARRIMIRLALAPIGAAICDAAENVLQLWMLTHTPTNVLASYALEATAAKWLGITIGVALSLAALVGRWIPRRA
jgi:hypothetical protein